MDGVDDGRADHGAISTVFSQVEDMLALRDAEADSDRYGGVLTDTSDKLWQVRGQVRARPSNPRDTHGVNPA